MNVWDPTCSLLSNYGKPHSLISLFCTELKFLVFRFLLCRQSDV